MTVADLSTSLVGAVAPFITHFIRQKWVIVHPIASHWLSLAVSTGCVALAYLSVNQSWDTVGFLSNAGLAFTLSQIVYTNISHRLESGGS